MPNFAANLTLLFNERPFLDRFEAAARAGFRAVEFLFPYAYDAHELRRLYDNRLPRAVHGRDPLRIPVRAPGRIGYQGWVGCEYRPLITTEARLGWIGRLTTD